MEHVTDATANSNHDHPFPRAPQPDVLHEIHLENHPISSVPTEQARRRTLILCFDGTYIPSTRPFGQVARAISVAADQAFAWFLQDHIIAGYRFLMNNYRDTDRICIFGFSRGAYTARCLAAMISCVGLLRKDNDELLPFAYSLFRESSGEGVFAAAAFRRKVSRDIQIEFMGLWDTVSSVGISNRTLPASLSRGVVKTFRQALALDERRAKFQELPFYYAPEDLAEGDRNVPELVFQRNPSWLRKLHRQMTLAHVLPGLPPLGPSPNSRPELPDATAEDRWFVGAHSDVGGKGHGGGQGLATLPFLWMLQELKKAKIDLQFKSDAFWRDPILARQCMDPHGIERAIIKVLEDSCELLENKISENSGNSRDGLQEALDNAKRELNYMKTIQARNPETETKERSKTECPNSGPRPADDPKPVLLDVNIDIAKQLNLACSAKIHDTLASGALPSGWHLLEWLPSWTAFFNEHGQRCNRLSINRGRGREIIFKEPKYHWSVHVRRATLSYTPKAVCIVDGKPSRD